MPRITLQVQLVLRALLADPGAELYGLEIVDATGLPPGTIYPIMARLEQAGWLESRWEVIDQRVEGRPRRRYYRLSADGAEPARAALAQADARRRPRRTDPIGTVPAGGALFGNARFGGARCGGAQ